MEDVTAIIVSFMREAYLEKCVHSLRQTYPDIVILVGNNSRHSAKKRTICEQNGATYVKLPYDCGITGGRNRLIAMAKTRFVMIGDDDFYYENGANVPMLRTLADGLPKIAGGRIIQNSTVKDYQGFIGIQDGVMRYEPLRLDRLEEQDGVTYKQCDITFNYFVAQRSIFDNAKWDENIKVAYEHSDFFLTAREAGIPVVFCPDAIVVHKPQDVVFKGEERNKYLKYRLRRSDREYFFNKWGVHKLIDMYGIHDDL